jgi:hypothetical protein
MTEMSRFHNQRLGFSRIVFTQYSGALTDGDYLLLIQDGDASNLSDAAAVLAVNRIGALPNFTDHTTEANKAQEVEVIIAPDKRYIRASIVSTNTSSGGLICVLAQLIAPRHVPATTDGTAAATQSP